MDIEASAFGHEYTTLGHGLVSALGAVGLAFVALSLALLLPARSSARAGYGWLAALGLAYGVVAVLAPAWAWLNTADPYFGGGEPRSYRVFRSLLERQIGAAALAGALASVASMIARARGVAERLAVGLAVVACGALILLSARESVALVRVDCLPRIERVGHPYLHVGRERTLEVKLTCGFLEPPAPVGYVAERAGPHEVRFEAHGPRVTVARAVTYEAGDERGPAAFSLREGRRFVYHRHRKEKITGALSGGTVLDRHDEVVIDVLPAEARDSIRVFPVRVRFGDAPPETLALVGWNGALARFEGERLETVLNDPLPGERLEGFVLPGVCEGAPPSGPRAPTRCRKGVGAVAGLSATMMRLFTLGTATYLPERTVFTLERIEDRDAAGAALEGGGA